MPVPDIILDTLAMAGADTDPYQAYHAGGGSIVIWYRRRFLCTARAYGTIVQVRQSGFLKYSVSLSDPNFHFGLVGAIGGLAMVMEAAIQGRRIA